jgi:ABC-type dipeptide/oligopeptide/nickel transport system permease component
MVPVIIGVTLIVFLTMRVLPGDPARLLLRDLGATQEQVADMRAALGLDRPLHVQYFRYLTDVLRGDLQDSYSMRQPVLTIIVNRLPATIELALAALILSVVIGVIAGTVAAARQNSVVDYVTTTIVTVGLSMPTFWIGLMLILYFSATQQLLPSFGRIGDIDSFSRVTGLYLLDSVIQGNVEALTSALRHLFLPATALAIALSTFITRVVRASMIEALSQDYVRTATSKGLRRWRVVVAHGLRNALLPVVTLIGIQFGNLLSGAIVVETVFAWPGLGRLVVDGIYQQDFPLVQGAVLMFAVIRLALNLLTDLLYARIDPRISYA